jgi:hypothetical protein
VVLVVVASGIAGRGSVLSISVCGFGVFLLPSLKHILEVVGTLIRIAVKQTKFYELVFLLLGTLSLG